MKEIRIYFECLEQANHFIKPILEETEAFKSSLFEIKLIKLTGNYIFYSKLVAPVVYLKDPDILITIVENDIESLIDYKSLGKEVQLAIPTPEHYLPLLYICALKNENDGHSFFNDKPVMGSLTMTSVKMG